MTDDEQDAAIRGAFSPIPLSDAASRRIRPRIAVEVDRRRIALLDGALHGGFALAAVAWTLLMVVGR